MIKIKSTSSQAKKKGKSTQITNIRNERRDIITDLIDTERIIKKCYEQFCAHTFDNLDEMDQFLERYNLPKLIRRNG